MTVLQLAQELNKGPAKILMDILEDEGMELGKMIQKFRDKLVQIEEGTNEGKFTVSVKNLVLMQRSGQVIDIEQ